MVRLTPEEITEIEVGFAVENALGGFDGGRLLAEQLQFDAEFFDIVKGIAQANRARVKQNSNYWRNSELFDRGITQLTHCCIACFEAENAYELANARAALAADLLAKLIEEDSAVQIVNVNQAIC